MSEQAVPAETGSDDAPVGADRARRRAVRSAVVAVIVSVVVVALIAALVALGLHRLHQVREQDAAQDDRAAAISLAQRAVIDLTVLSTKTADAQLKELSAISTSAFKTQLNQLTSALKQTLSQGKVTATGSIAAAGIESQTAKQVKVLVAASGTVKNVNTKKPEPRSYRMRVTLTPSGGHWLISNMEFVS